MHPERWEDRAAGMQQAMWERNTGAERMGRDSMASGAPMVQTQQGYADNQMVGNGRQVTAPAYPAPARM